MAIVPLISVYNEPMTVSPLRVVVYGDHELDRSQKEQSYITAAQAEGKDILTIDLANESEDSFAEKMGTTSLFGSQRFIRIYNLEKIRSGKTITAFLESLETGSDDVLVVIRGAMTPAKKKLFGKNWKLQEFKFPAVLFQFLESIKVIPIHDCFQMYRQILETESEWSLHALAARQFRLLLAAKTGAPILAPPFAQGKLKSQAKKFSIEELVQILHTLYDIERQIKTGRTPLSWSQQFDIVLTRLYQ